MLQGHAERFSTVSSSGNLEVAVQESGLELDPEPRRLLKARDVRVALAVSVDPRSRRQEGVLNSFISASEGSLLRKL